MNLAVHVPKVLTYYNYPVFKVWAQNAEIQEISGISYNVDIPCLNSDPDANVFWIINGSVYGLLQIPDEYILCKEGTCNLNDLTISVVQSEMDGYTFQCVSIDYHTNTQQLGIQKVLSVITLTRSQVEAINGELMYPHFTKRCILNNSNV